VQNAKDNKRCPFPGCQTKAEPSHEKIRFFQAILDTMFKDYSIEDDNNDTVASISTDGQHGEGLTIALLTGESVEVPYSPSMDVMELKRRVQMKLKLSIGKQRLMYQDKELTVCSFL